ncbi:cupin domain-containing protein [Dendryphion nanum]|uniref:Cupin domain-containing protein n=1 Tax=Dendryphion nanum TaxID=256645 RepID=A0A9P9IEM2_9PLEO|nr:cupin domain-containing protein [Dendryphion nanum]
MPVARKRENRENQFYNVGEQGRKTGIRLEDKGVRDEYGMEPISGIFSSPEKSPPKRNAPRSSRTMTDSESMDIQESSVPDLTTGHLLQRNRPNLPPPRSRSPMKTALGSSPRRQSSMGPRAHPVNENTISERASSQPTVNRMLDFDQEESFMQETPALSGSGARRGKARANIYDLEVSPSRGQSAVMEESMVQEEIIANEESGIGIDYAEESFVGAIGDDSMAGAEVEDISVDVEESEIISEVIVQPNKRGRKRKSDALEATKPAEPRATRIRKRLSKAEEASPAQKRKKVATASSPAPKPKARGRPPKSIRASDVSAVEDSAIMDVPLEDSATEPPAPIAPRRGRPRKDDSKTSTRPPAKGHVEEVAFTKPAAPIKGKAKVKPNAKPAKETAESPPPGRLVDSYGNPLSKDDIERMSITSAGSRFGRGRSLSVYRLMAPGESGTVGKTGRRRLPPVNFWKNEQARYDLNGNLEEIVRNETQELPKHPKKGRTKGAKRRIAPIEEEEEEELAEWEEKEGVFVGVYPQYDPVTGLASEETVLEDTLAWSEKGIDLKAVADGGFSFQKLGSAPEAFMSWGCIGLKPDGQKRTKNTRRMHMCLHVTKGAVEAVVDKNVFTVHKGGIWHVPRGTTYSMKNVSASESRIFFVQSYESIINADES